MIICLQSTLKFESYIALRVSPPVAGIEPKMTIFMISCPTGENCLDFLQNQSFCKSSRAGNRYRNRYKTGFCRNLGCLHRLPIKISLLTYFPVPSAKLSLSNFYRREIVFHRSPVLCWSIKSVYLNYVFLVLLSTETFFKKMSYLKILI